MKRKFNYKTLWDETNRTLKRAGLAWGAASLALATMLTYAPIAHAIIIDGDDPPPQCSLTASLSANPSSIDRNASPPSVNSTVTWWALARGPRSGGISAPGSCLATISASATKSR